MQVRLVVPVDTPVSLGKLKPGVKSIFYFADSADVPDDFFSILQDPGEHLFMVFEGGAQKDDFVDIVSLDGKQVLRRSAARSVRRVPFAAVPSWEFGEKKVRISNVEPGMIVHYVSPHRKDDDRCFLKVSGNPSPAGKVILVSLQKGEEVIVDDDLLVRAGVGHLTLNLKYA